MARQFRFESSNPVTCRAKRSWRLLRAQLIREQVAYIPKVSKLVHELPEIMSTGTVGAIARDRDGNIAAATSTGGLALRPPGRIGDTPLMAAAHTRTS